MSSESTDQQNASDVSVVIPTLDDDPSTLDSIPDGVETAVVSEGNRAEARNIGAARTSGEVLVFCDDDIVFDESFLSEQIESLEEGVVLGLEDFDFGLLLTRFLAIHRVDFEALDGFDPRLNHMEDTEFSLRARSAGLTVRPIPRTSVEHIDHESIGQSRASMVLGTLYLCLKYPRATPELIWGMIFS
jgi:GT2 family glycosyltransferase